MSRKAVFGYIENGAANTIRTERFMVQNLEPEDPEAIEPKIGDCPIWENFLGRKTVDEEGLLEIYLLRTGGSYRITQTSGRLLGIGEHKI